jgi:hypothetical protein
MVEDHPPSRNELSRDLIQIVQYGTVGSVSLSLELSRQFLSCNADMKMEAEKEHGFIF